LYWKIQIRQYFTFLVGLGLGSTFRGEARRGRGDTSSSPRYSEPRKPRSFEASMYDVNVRYIQYIVRILMYFWTEFGYTYCNQWIPTYECIHHHFHIFCCASQEDRDAKPNHKSSIIHHFTATMAAAVSRSGFMTARRPPDQMRRNLRTTKLITQTTSYSNFIVIAAFFVRRDHGQFRPTNLESIPFHHACHHDGIITRGPLLHKIAPT
jgi:hypothetical protein